MNIPDEAVAAASEAIITDMVTHRDPHVASHHARLAVEAAAPALRAHTLAEAADHIDTMAYGSDVAPYLSAVKAQLRAAAREMDTR